MAPKKSAAAFGVAFFRAQLSAVAVVQQIVTGAAGTVAKLGAAAIVLVAQYRPGIGPGLVILAEQNTLIRAQQTL